MTGKEDSLVAEMENNKGPAARALILRALRHLILGGPLPLEVQGQVDLGELSRLVSRFNGGALMHLALSPTDLPAELRTQWQRLRMQWLRENTRALRTVSKLFTGLESAGIPAATMRGLPLAHTLYPDPSLRPMHDVDILIRPEDATRCEAVLKALGHSPVERLRSQHVYHIDGTIVEVHRSVLTAKRYRKAIRPSDLLATRQQRLLPDGTVLHVLSPEHELICLVCHALVHHEMERLLFVVDIGLLESQENIDWEYVREFCRKARLTRMVGLTLAFVNNILDLGYEEVVRMLDVPAAAIGRFFDAYRARLFGETGLRHYVMRKRAQLYMAETPIRRFRQILRLFSLKEMRTLWGHLSRKPQLSIDDDWR